MCAAGGRLAPLVCRRLGAFALVFLALAACGDRRGSAANPTSALTDIGQGLRGPRGLQASVYAEGLANVAVLAEDPQGRLWAGTSTYSGTESDGVYVVTGPGSTPQLVVSGLRTPLGLLWYQDALYVASSDGVDAFAGFDGAHFAEHRAVVALPAGAGQPNGLVATSDGRLLLGISAPCDHCVPASEYAASIVSFRPDGTDLRTFAHGIRAPVGLALYPGTNDLLVTMNQRDDLGDATPGDWLAVVAPDQAWGFPDCYGQGGSACVGVPQPTAVLDKHAAVSGVAVVTGQLGKVVGTSAIVAEWATGQVMQVALTNTNGAYAGVVTTMITGMKQPVPVLLDRSGGLLVGDWSSGVVYRIA